MAIDPFCKMRISYGIVAITCTPVFHVLSHDALQPVHVLAALRMQLLACISKRTIENDAFFFGAWPTCAYRVAGSEDGRVKVNDVRIDIDIVIVEVGKRIGQIKVHDFLNDTRHL